MTVPIVLRAVKGTPLTNDEVDANFTNLKDGIEYYTAADVLIKIKTVDGTGSGLDADLLDGLNSSSSATASTIVARDASGNFSATTITANLTGNVAGNLTGNVTGNVTGSAGSVAYTGLTGGTPTWNQSTTGTAAGLSATLAVASGGTGAVNATSARANLVAAKSGANTDITSLALTTPLSVSQGGTGLGSLLDDAVLIGAGTGTVTSIAPGASGNILTSSGTSWTSAVPLTAATLTGTTLNSAIVNSSLTSVGTIIAGTWNGTPITVARGGTGGNGAVTGSGANVLGTSPTLSGTPLSTTAAVGTNTTQIATTAFAYGTLSAATNGYTILPNGLYIQWGTSASVLGDGSTTVTYPIAFPSAIYNVQITAMGTMRITGQGEDRVGPVGLTTFSLNHGMDGTGTFYWMAIGK